jgi:hypothetical protein
VAIDFPSKTGILAQFWIEFRDDEQLKDFIEYNDIGLPLAYFLAEGMVQPTPLAEQYVEETFSLFLSALEVTEEEVSGIDNLNTLLQYAFGKRDSEEEK